MFAVTSNPLVCYIFQVKSPMSAGILEVKFIVFAGESSIFPSGMMLEMDNSELLILLESEHQLKAKALRSQLGRWEIPQMKGAGLDGSLGCGS